MKPLGPTDPQRVGQYRLLGKLGAGGMGSVYLARSDRGRTVAVKLVQPELARQPEFRQRFKQEVEAARRIGGEFTAPVLGGDTEAETPWVATGYVAGPSLHEVITTTYGSLPERTLRILANGLVRALRDIHAAGMVHRDLKPSNVLITIDGPRVIDFGIARALESHEGLTRTGAAVGSPGFMSPEQCRGETVTAASDIFCLGSVLTFAATGRTPFGDANSPMTALMLAIVQDEKDISGVPEGMRGLVEHCLAQNPANRPSLDQLLRWTETPAELADGADEREPWLPGALVAVLGRHAVELLDSEDPLQAPPMPTMQPPPAMPASPPPVTPLPPSGPPAGPPPASPASPPPGMVPQQTPTQFAPSTPPPSPPPSPAPSPPPPAASGVNYGQTMTSATPPTHQAPQAPQAPQTPHPPQTGSYPPPQAGSYGYPAPGGGYGYPQQQGAPPTPMYGSTPPPAGVNTPYQMGQALPSGPGGPGGPGHGRGGPGGQNKKTVWIIVAAAVVAVALIVGITVVALGGGDSEDKADDPTGEPTGEPTNEPTDQPTDQPTEDPTVDPSATVPTDMVGGWEGQITDTSGSDEGIFRRMEISEGSAGSAIATTWNVYADVMCIGSGELVSGDGSTQITMSSSMTRTVPSDQECTAYGEQTLTLQSDGTLLWENPTDGLQAVLERATGVAEDSQPSSHMGTFNATTADGTALEVVTETIAAAGELAVTYTSDTCTWEAEMVSGDVSGDVAIYGPGEVTSGSCEPMPAYRVTSILNEETYFSDLEFTRLDGTSPDFVAEYESTF
jgi:serine/threonine protein kinase